MTGAGRRARLRRARLYLCAPVRPDLERFTRAVLEGGVDVLQLRDKEATDAAIVAAAGVVRALCHEQGALFIVNDRPDLAAEAGADGVHLGQQDGSSAEARALLGPDALIGRSTHSREEIRSALEEGVDYLGVGPVHATPTKPGRPGVGLGLVVYAASHSRLPFFVTGGMTAETVPDAVRAGAHGIVVVRALTEVSDPHAAAAALKRAIETSRGSVAAM